MCVITSKIDKKIAIIGATSFIGRHILLYFLKKGYSVIATYRKENQEALHSIKKEISGLEMVYAENIIWVTFDLLKIDMSKEFLRQLKECYTIYLCAWSGTNSRDDPILNYSSKNNLFELMREVLSIQAVSLKEMCSIRKVIFLGTQAEYGKKDGIVDENTVCAPCSSYGKAKLIFGTQIEQLCKERGILFYHFRLHSVYGRHRGGLLRAVANSLIENKYCKLRTSCKQHWNYLYIDDCVKALVYPVENNIIEGIYNIGHEENMSLRDYLEEFRILIDPDSTIFYGEDDDDISEDFYYSSKLFEDITGFKAEVSFRDGIKNLLLTSEFVTGNK